MAINQANASGIAAQWQNGCSPAPPSQVKQTLLARLIVLRESATTLEATLNAASFVAGLPGEADSPNKEACETPATDTVDVVLRHIEGSVNRLRDRAGALANFIGS